MNAIILEALEVLTESEDFNRLVDDIRQEVINTDASIERNGSPTDKWLAGLLASRGAADGKLNRLIQELNAGNLNPEGSEMDPNGKAYRDAVRAKAAFARLYRAKMVNLDSRGRYTFPTARTPDGPRKLARLSDLRRFLSSDFNQTKIDSDTKKSFREQKDVAISEVISNLPPEQQRYANVFASLTVSAYNLLLNLYKKRGPRDVANFRSTVNDANFNESQDFMLLRELGLVNEKNLLNRGELVKFGAFLRSTTPQLKMQLNKEVVQSTKISQHTRQRSLNAAGKPSYGEDDAAIEQDDTQLSSDMSGEESRAINSRIRDIDAGTKNSSKNDRAAGYKRTFSDVFKNPFA